MSLKSFQDKVLDVSKEKILVIVNNLANRGEALSPLVAPLVALMQAESGLNPSN